MTVSPDIYKDMAEKLARAYVKKDYAHSIQPIVTKICDTQTPDPAKGDLVWEKVRDFVSGASLSINFLPLMTKTRSRPAFYVISKDMERVIGDYNKVMRAFDDVKIYIKSPNVQIKRK